MADMIEVENINTPGKTTRVNAAKYANMKAAFEKALPKSSPGLTQAETRDAVKPHLSEDLFPGGATCGWWAKAAPRTLRAASRYPWRL